MFESSASGRTLEAAALAKWQASLAAASGAASGLDDAQRIDAIRALEGLVCAATAVQASLAAELDESQRTAQADAGVPAERQGRGVALQVALARRESHHRGQRHLGLAKIVARELPHTWTAWRAGLITEWKATLIARESACLDLEDRLAVDAAVASDSKRLERMGERELVAACQKEAYRLDPAAFVKRRRQAEADRNVTCRPAPDAMLRLSALLPVEDGVAVKVALTRKADAARAAGDPRTKGQLEADTLVESVLGAAASRDDDVTRWEGPTNSAEPSTDVGINLGLVMTDQALFGTSDEAAHLHGYGPIPADLARELVSGACSREERVWLRRLYTSPTTGELISMDARGRTFRGGLGRFIQLRDQVCRTPWCDAPIRHTDHAQACEEGGPSTGDNGQGLCEACNYAKEALGWRARPSPADGRHEVETTTPTGHSYRSSPPMVATIGETPIRIDYLLAG